MTVKQLCKQTILAGAAMLFLNGAGLVSGQSILIDFGNNSSFRGVNVANPDVHGNYWNSVIPGATVANLIDTANAVTAVDLVFSTPAGTDSYNGPAGVTTGPTPAEIAATDIDAAALGDLGITNAAIDFAAGAPGAVRFELQQLDPTKTYDLTFFGSHKYNTDNVTRYGVYTDNTYSTPVASVDLTVGVNNNHNRDTVVTLTDLAPQAGNILYVQFVGTGGSAGYLNCMEVAVHSLVNTPPVAGSGSYSVLESGTLAIAAADLASDPDNDTVLFSSIGDTNPVDYGAATLTGGGATLSYTNTSGTPGSTDLFSYTVTDGNSGYATNAISIRIDPADGAHLVSATTDGGYAYLTYAAWPTTNYSLDWTPELTPPVTWQAVSTNAADLAGLLRFTNLLAPAPTNTFFRVHTVDTTPPGPARGASLPYRTYEAEAGTYGGGAALLGPSFNEADAASEASGRRFIELNQTAEYVQWTVQETARGMVLRFTMPDAANGGGTSATLGLYVNGSRVASLGLTSKWAWQYFPYVSSTMDPSNDPSTGRPRMRFDDYRHIFPSALNPGDVVRLQKDAQDTSTYGIDLIELEPVPSAIAAPANSLNVTSYGAVPDDGGDDWNAFNSCESAARSQGMVMYIPPGRFNLGQRWSMYTVTVQGAGVWHTEVHFTNPNNSGLRGEGSGVMLNDLYVTTETTSRNGEHGIAGYFGQNSVISNLWLTHTATGAWIGDYSGNNLLTDGLVFSGCRFRNTYADGLNLVRGTKNSIVENSHFRNNGDDAMACWPSDSGTFPETINNTYRFNTVENTWRAAGLGIFGGRGHVAHDCLFRDISGQAGIRFNTVFAGHPFSTASEMTISNMTLVRITGVDLWGTKRGAIAFETANSPVHYIRLSNLEIQDALHYGVSYETSNVQPIDHIYFNTATIDGSGGYGIYVRNGAGGWSENSYVTISNSGAGAVWDFSVGFDLRKIVGNVGW